MGGVFSCKNCNFSWIIIIKIYIFIQPLRRYIIMFIHCITEILVIFIIISVEFPCIFIKRMFYKWSCRSQKFHLRIDFVNGFFKCNITWCQIYMAAFPLFISDSYHFEVETFWVSHFCPKASPFCRNITVCKFY